MPETVTADAVLEAAASDATSFGGSPSAPVRIRDASGVTLDELTEVEGRYRRHGFAVVALASDPLTPDTLIVLGRALGLGDPFVPPLYSSAGSSGAPVSEIAAAQDVADAYHPSFQGTSAIALHCDGTLQAIGYVKASILLCCRPAAEGGATILFNAAAAYAQLVEHDRAAARALATPGVLVRQANLNGCSDVNVGPAFVVDDGRLVCGYSVSDTDRWAVPGGIAEADVFRGVGFLLHASLERRHRLELDLDAGHAIVMDNTRVSHGRTPYRDSAEQRRRLFRTLHLRHPARIARDASDTSDLRVCEGAG